MKSAISLLLVLLWAGSAGAVVDPDADQMGIYFDTTANEVCRSVPPTDVFDAYIIYTRPTLTSIRGFECSFRMDPSSGSDIFLLDRAVAANGVDLGDVNVDRANFLVGFYDPLPTTEATVLVHLTLLTTAYIQADFYLEPAIPASLDSAYPLVVAEDFSLLQVGYSAPEGPSATVNGSPCDVVATDEATWDSIKAMYR